MPLAAPNRAFWTQPLNQTWQELPATPDGLSHDEAQSRLQRAGPNELHPHRQRALLWEYLRRFSNPLVLILLFASGVSALTGDAVSFSIIVGVVLMSVTLDFVQERRAGQAAARLQQSVALRARVLRGGRFVQLPQRELAPGDVVEISAGDLVPADLRLFAASDLFVNQSILTGEPYPVEKRPAESSETDIASAEAAAFMGTSVVSGHGRGVVCRTGSSTFLGEIAETISVRPPATAFESGMRQFGLLLMRVTILLVLFVVAVNLLFHRPPLESFLFAVALAVGLTPELLPMIASVTLARGALRMSREKVIVKRLSSIQDLGSMDVLCTDKTGTLTEAKIRLEHHVDVRGEESERVLRLAWLNSYFETGIRSPLDDAILAHEELDVGQWKKLDEVPFDFERRRVSVLVDDGSTRLLIAKGAPEEVLRCCASYAIGEETRELDEETLSSLKAQIDGFSAKGFRVLGIACRQVGQDHPHAVLSDESALVFIGLAAFLDPPKLSARPAVDALTRHGIEVKVVTGDNELVTRHVCDEIGLAVRGVLLGSEIEHLDENALTVRAQETSLFCRVSPAQKSRVIRALRRSGHVVGYLGDGINDAPPLRAADVGISVDEAVDVAKEAADMILLQQDLGVLDRGVLEGRRTFANVMKYLMMGTSSNFGNMFSMAGASLVLPFLPMLPVQILLNNLIYDVSELPIPLDSVDASELEKPHRWDLGFLQRFMVFAGSISSLFDFATFAVLLSTFHASPSSFRTGWFIESMATQLLVIYVIRTRGKIWQSRPSALLLSFTAICLCVAVGVPFSPLGHRLGFGPAPIALLPTLALLVVTYLILVEAMKRVFFSRMGQR
jgi:Mg2+-importing ATPase